MNGDGKPDLVVVQQVDITDDKFAVLLGNGDGTFQNPTYFSAGNFPIMASFGDFNNDGLMDLAIADFGNGYASQGGTFVSLQTNGPAVQLNPVTESFPLQVYDTRSGVQPIQLTNVGKETLAINQISIQGADPRDYPEQNNCGGSVAVGASCTIQVAFRPIFKGERRATLVVNTNSIGAEQQVPLNGLATFVTMSATHLNFGDQKVGTTSPPQTVTVNNVGPQAVNISNVNITYYYYSQGNEFQQTNNCSVIAPGSSCTITVTFAPTVKGAADAELWVHHNGGGGAQDVVLNGVGTN